MSSGPVLFQEGDYFGQTVNLSARIADYARPGEVLVTRSVVEASEEPDIGFRAIGPVDLKGVAGSTELLLAHQT
jgi:adenylate cyclase